MEIRLLTATDAEAWWQLRLEMLRNDSVSFADSAEEHEATTIETAKKHLGAGDLASSFVL